jgi:hypothetical protein
MLRRALVLACLFLALFVAPATAEEVIRSYDVAVKLLADRSVDVTERIEVYAQGIDIRHGIYRDIPYSLRNDDGSLLRSKLTVISVSRDGAPEPYDTETLDNNIERIQIGSAETFLADGIHRYEIHYTMTRMGRSFADHDELYWNVTGNYWIFPILSTTATIELPAGAKISDIVGYTGPPGSQEKAVSITRVNDTTATVRSTRELQAGEGMSVAVAFPAGVLEPAGNNPGDWISDHRDTVVPPVAVLVVLGYFLLAWRRFGRDPAKGTIIPLFHPPEGYEPAALQYVDRMGWQQNGWTAFTASIFDLGVKGLVTIDKSSKTLTVTPTGKAPAAALPPGEALVHDFVTKDGQPLKVDKNTGPEINATRGKMLAAVTQGVSGRYFHKNRLQAIIGIVLSFIVLFAMVVADVLPAEGLIGAVVGIILISVVLSIVRSTWSRGGLLRFLPIIWIVIVGINLVGGLGVSFTQTHFNLAWVAVASIIAIDILFFVLMPAPTAEGRKLMDQIDGFKMYVNTAEKDRLNLIDEPPMTVTRFESVLPFAIALGIEKPWSHYFESELARNAVSGVSGSHGYSPAWYSGSDFSSRSFSSGLSAMAAGMSAAMIAAQPASSSSSGFSGGGGGGGGGSGGGGGGGGGGGW